MRRKRLRQDVHPERGTDPPQTYPQRPQAVSLFPLREAIRQEGSPQETLPHTFSTERGVRGARHAAVRRLGNVADGWVPSVRFHVQLLRMDQDQESMRRMSSACLRLQT